MFRISSRTFSRGWNPPPFGGIPSASKLYFLNVEVFHDPLPINGQKTSLEIGNSGIYSRCNHVRRKVSFRLGNRRAKVRSLMHREPLSLSLSRLGSSRIFGVKMGILLNDQLSFPQIGQSLLSSLEGSSRIYFPEFQLRLVFNRSDLSTNRRARVTVKSSLKPLYRDIPI